MYILSSVEQEFRKSIAKIVYISKKTIVSINETKSWFFEKINKIDKLLARLIKKKQERNQINKIRNEKKKELQLMPQKYKGS